MGANASRRPQPEAPRAPLLGAAASNAITFPGAGNDAGEPPLVVGTVMSSAASAAMDDEAVCAVCIGGMSLAAPYALPTCHHTFHGVCIAAALRVSRMCPLCRCEVCEDTAQAVIAQLAADTVPGEHQFSQEVVEDLKNPDRRPETGSREEEAIIKELREMGACRGDHGKIPAIAAMLGRGAGALAQARHSGAVRVAAVQALRAIVPTFAGSWPGLQHILELLNGIALGDPCEEVRCAAIQAIQEVATKGDPTELRMLRELIDSQSTKPDVRYSAANAVTALVVRQDLDSSRAAMAAFSHRDHTVRSVGFNAVRVAAGTRGECPELIANLAEMAELHSDSEARADALKLIAQFEVQGGEVGAAVAARCLQDAEEDVREAALSALRSLWRRGDPRAVTALSQLIGGGTSHGHLRAAALGILTQVAAQGDAEACSAAALALSDEEDAVRSSALASLKQLCRRGDGEVVALLLGQLGQRNQDVLMLVVEALGQVARRGDAEVTAALKGVMARGDELEYAADQALKHLQ